MAAALRAELKPGDYSNEMVKLKTGAALACVADVSGSAWHEHVNTIIGVLGRHIWCAVECSD